MDQNCERLFADLWRQHATDARAPADYRAERREALLMSFAVLGTSDLENALAGAEMIINFYETGDAKPPAERVNKKPEEMPVIRRHVGNVTAMHDTHAMTDFIEYLAQQQRAPASPKSAGQDVQSAEGVDQRKSA